MLMRNVLLGAGLLAVAGLPLLSSAILAWAKADSGYSALSEITADNVAQLRLAYSLELPARDGYFAEPQIAGDALLVLTPFPHTLFAFDLRGDPLGAVKW